MLTGCSLVFLGVFTNLGLAGNKVYCCSLSKGGINPQHSAGVVLYLQGAQCRLWIVLELV